MNAVNNNGKASDCQSSFSNWASEADHHLAAAVERIMEVKSDSVTAPAQTCVLLLELIEVVRLPLRRLANVREPAHTLKVQVQL